MAIQPDAAESNAGDDFHLVWAARRALHLLDPSGELKGVRLEGPSPRDTADVDPDGSELLGIDLAEYFMGTTFESASKVVHEQLKYSTRHSNDTWTASRLVEGKHRGCSGSIIHRLVQFFKAYLDRYGRNDVLAKLQIRLVSNRPCSTELASALFSAKTLLRGMQQLRSADLISQLNAKDKCQIKKLKSASSAIKSHDFCDFLRILDLSGCGEGSRLDQEIALVREIGQLGFAEVKQQYSGLIELCRRRMEPENRNCEVLTADDIVPILGIPSVQQLFPASSRFGEADEYIQREQAADIAHTIISTEDKPICIHGAAGIGKTTFVRSLESLLPNGSVLVLFDSYGGGSYLDPSEVRHGHARAIMQIANELASRAGSALLLNRDQSTPELLRSLKERMNFASRVLGNRNPEALVVIVIDAADNSIAAAMSRNESCFVKDMLACSLPARCRLIVTARTVGARRPRPRHRSMSILPPP